MVKRRLKDARLPVRLPPHRFRVTWITALLIHVGSEDVLEHDQPAAELAGRIWDDLERTGQPIGLVDPIIAANALTHGLERVTGNTSHYQRIQQLGYPLILVNWRQ
jgi:predicted nucleic acid-binding protein